MIISRPIASQTNSQFYNQDYQRGIQFCDHKFKQYKSTDDTRGGKFAISRDSKDIGSEIRDSCSKSVIRDLGFISTKSGIWDPGLRGIQYIEPFMNAFKVYKNSKIGCIAPDCYFVDDRERNQWYFYGK